MKIACLLSLLVPLATASAPAQSPTTIEGAKPFEIMSDAISQLVAAMKLDMNSTILPIPEDAKMSIPDQIRSRGYSFEDFDVTTEDGYINKLWHVWDNSTTFEGEPGERVVFMQHGLMDCGGTWFFNNQSESIGYDLVKKGKDVWLGNNRGTYQSQKHVSLTTSDRKYWDFSFNEMGKYDVPANVDFILNKTGEEQLTYIGHSQGTIQFWIQNIVNPDFGKKIYAMAAFAPVMYTGHQSSAFITTVLKWNLDILPLMIFDTVAFYGHKLITQLGPAFIDRCPRTSWAFMQTIAGFDKVSQMDYGRLPIVMDNDAGGTSSKNMRHWAKLGRSGKFEDMDNVEYDTSVLKDNLANTYIALFVGENDAISQPEDVAILKSFLPESTVQFDVPDYNHLDYMWADDVDTVIKPTFYKWLEGL